MRRILFLAAGVAAAAAIAWRVDRQMLETVRAVNESADATLRVLVGRSYERVDLELEPERLEPPTWPALLAELAGAAARLVAARARLR